MTSYDYPCAFQSWGPDEDAAINRVLGSGRFTMGEEVAAFEAEFAAFHGMRHAIMVNSGSSANLIAVAALVEDGHIARGDKVIVPALAWSTTYAPLAQHGLELVLCDVDGTWNAHPELLITDRDAGAKLVVGCSILGNPAPLAGWAAFAASRGAVFMEDNCESLGAAPYSGTGIPERRCGTFGKINTFSLFWSHQLSAIEGGVILTDDDALNRYCRMLRAHGWTRDLDKPVTFEDEYDFHLFGYNVRPLELHAAIARAQLPKVEGFRRFREQNLNNFLVWAAGLPLQVQSRSGVQSPFGIAFTVKDRATRGRLATALRAGGVDCRLPTGGSFTKHPYGQAYRDQPTPNADIIHECGLFLGNAPFDIGDKIQHAVEIMRGVL